MREKPTLEYIWNRVTEVSKPLNRVELYEKLAKTRGYTIEEIRRYLSTIFTKSGKYNSVPVGDPYSETVPDIKVTSDDFNITDDLMGGGETFD